MICKEYHSKIYLTSQKFFKEIDVNELNQIDNELDITKAEISELKDINLNLQSGKLNIIQNIK